MPSCGHNPPVLPPAGEAYSTRYCRLCWLDAYSAPHRERWHTQGERPNASNGVPPPSGLPTADSACVIRKVRLRLPYLCYNPTLLADASRMRLVYRRNRMGSTLHQCELTGADYAPGESWPLHLSHPNCLGGIEDPRVFPWRGRWCVAFAGVECVTGTTNHGVAVHQAVAMLDKTSTQAERIWLPSYAKGNIWEKNWGFFAHERELYSVYSIRPHLVLHHHDGVAYPFTEHQWSPQWSGGHMRGGASPVRHRGEMWSFFHGSLDHAGFPHRTYSLGCYIFEAHPPFRPKRYTPNPILLPPKEGWPRELGVSVVFPGGAFFRDGKWVVAYGVHDSWCHIAEIDPEILERSMVAC